MRRFLATLILTCAMLALTALLQPAAACALSITDLTSTTWTGARGRGYDVFDTRRVAQAVTFRIRSSDGGCSFFATVAPTATTGRGAGFLRHGSATLQYTVAKDASGSQPLSALNLASVSETFSSTMAAGAGTASFQFAFALAPQQVVPPGQYTDQMEISVYEGSLANPILRDRRRFTVTVPVPAVAELSFSEGSDFDVGRGSYTVNFQNLRAGSRRDVRLKVRSNAGYRINFQSANGALRHVDAADGSEVPYTISVDSGNLHLRRGVPMQAILSNDVTDPGGRQHLINFTVGDIGSASAGDYTDIIDLSVFTLR